MAEKLKLGLYWAAACGGCDVAVLDLHEKILDVAAAADIYFWPFAMDFKLHDVEAMPDGYLDVCLFNGAIRNSEQEEIAKLLRAKSKVMAAFGSCACFGGIPALANFFTGNEVLQRVYEECPSNVNPDVIRPQPKLQAMEGELTLPEFFNSVYRLQDIVPVEYFIPGCPPPPELIWKAVEAIVSGNLPPVGATIAEEKTLCDTCPRVKEEKKVKAFHRISEVIPDPQKCFLEQGIICCGPATRGGCGARCIAANMPCRGCFGPTSRIVDQGAALASAIASMVDSKDEKEIRQIIDQIVDPAGTFYRFGLADSLLKGKVMREEASA